MSIQIGKLLPDGSVRHIKALHETLSKDLVRKLRVFYPNDRRVDALLSLGDIQKLGPSPYGKWTGTGDTVHCFSKIRDGRGNTAAIRITHRGQRRHFRPHGGHVPPVR